MGLSENKREFCSAAIMLARSRTPAARVLRAGGGLRQMRLAAQVDALRAAASGINVPGERENSGSVQAAPVGTIRPTPVAPAPKISAQRPSPQPQPQKPPTVDAEQSAATPVRPAGVEQYDGVWVLESQSAPGNSGSCPNVPAVAVEPDEPCPTAITEGQRPGRRGRCRAPPPTDPSVRDYRTRFLT